MPTSLADSNYQGVKQHLLDKASVPPEQVLAINHSHMKQTGMLVVSLRGVNFGFWSRLGCSEQSANILCRQGLV